MANREPKDATVLAARIAKAFPSLSAYSAATLAESLCSIERAQRRHAERCCNGSDGGYVRIRWLGRDDDNAGSPVVREHDPEAEERAATRINSNVARWLARLRELTQHPHPAPYGHYHDSADLAWSLASIELQHDHRGRVLLIQLPGELEAASV